MIISNMKYIKHKIYNWLSFYFKLQFQQNQDEEHLNPNIKRLVFGLKCLNIIRRNFSEGKLANPSTLINVVEGVEEQ